MKKKHIAICTLVALTAVPAPVLAGPYGDAMTKCFVNATSGADRTALVQWIFATAALHPDVSRLSAATDSDRESLNKRIGALLERLLTKACVSETKEAVRYEGNATLDSSFNVLGQVAGGELLSAPSVTASMANFAKYLDEKIIKEALAP